MVEKMKMVHIVTSASAKDEMLKGLREIGVMHLAEKQSADREVSDRFQTLSKTEMALKDYAEPKQKPADGILTDDEFNKMYDGVLEAMDRKSALGQEISAANTEIDRIAAWGDFSPQDLKDLKEAGYDFHFYRMGSKEFQALQAEEDVRFIRLAPVDKQDAVAVFGTLPPSIQATEFIPGESSMSELKQKIEDARKGIDDCDGTLKAASVYDASFKDQLLKLQNEMNYSSASATAQGDDDFVWISGYVPEVELDKVKAMAAEKNCAWAAEDVAEDDDMIPTKLRFNKVSKLIEPVFNILGVLPGYREQDVSLWFFLFFTLFFAMIIGDGGYGVLILLGTIALRIKQKKGSTVTFLLFVLSIATVIWGAVTGTWFGMESAMKVPLLKNLVIPSLATYPEYFGLTANVTQNAIMKFSFSIGAIQMVLGSILSIKEKLPKKDLSWVASLGWAIAVVAMYLLALNLVIHEDISLVPVFALIGVAFVLVLLFGGMSPDLTFGQGLKAGLANAFTDFLDTISCFGNVMSYIRLFAVGMAGVAISQSFNGIAAGMHGPLIILGVLVVLIGHALNIIMCFLSVVVHGVRLNVLEFSGQVGLEWTGLPYEPFKKVNK
jgi:V/A-type H+-transporting ATPase subunit I